MFVLNYICLIFLLHGATAANLPSFINACSASDPNVNACIEKAIAVAGPYFADGIPELGVAPLDPVELGTVQVDNPALKIVFTDTVVKGLRGFKVNAYKLNSDQGKAILDFTANVTLKAHYVMDGRILILPIRGKGDARIKITNLNIIVNYDFETKSGHWMITGYKDQYKMDRAQFKFTNLFGGNKELADTIDTVINKNWKPVINDIAPDAFEQIIKTCVDKSKKLLAVVAANELLVP